MLIGLKKGQQMEKGNWGRVARSAELGYFWSVAVGKIFLLLSFFLSFFFFFSLGRPILPANCTNNIYDEGPFFEWHYILITKSYHWHQARSAHTRHQAQPNRNPNDVPVLSPQHQYSVFELVWGWFWVAICLVLSHRLGKPELKVNNIG